MNLRIGSIEIEITLSWIHLQSTNRGLYWCWVKGHREFVTDGG